MSVYSTSFFAGTINAGDSATVGLSDLEGVVVIRSVLFSCAAESEPFNFNIQDSLGNNFLIGAGYVAPFSVLQELRQVWPAGRDMVINVTGGDTSVFVSGYLLSST